MGWLRQLLPAAVLLVAPPKVPAVEIVEEMADVITLDADEIVSGGPLALADALASARRLGGRR